MKFTFQTFCIAVVITFLHLSAIAVGSAWFGVSEETAEEKKIDLSKIAEEFLDESKSKVHESPSSISTEEEPAHPLALQDPDQSPQEPSSKPAKSEDEAAAMAEASDLAGRIERPKLGNYATEEKGAPPIIPSQPSPPAHTEEPAGPHSIRAIQPTTRS